MQVCDLPWLPSPPPDFAQICRDLGPSSPALGSRIQHLATHALSAVQSAALTRRIGQSLAAQAAAPPLRRFRLAYVCNATVDGIADCMPAAAARHGVALEVFVPAYDQVVQEAFDKNSMTNTIRPDATLLAV